MNKTKRSAIIKDSGKTRISLYLDNQIIQHFRTQAEKTSKGYQTLMNDCLHEAIQPKQDFAVTFRRLLREELKKFFGDKAKKK